jgi:neutral ceramidase
MRVLACLILGAVGGWSAELQFGRAAVSITPTGVKEVLDEIYAKAAVFEKDGTSAAIVVCDLVVINKPIVETARRLIQDRTGIPGANVMISATHTHTGLPPGWGGPSPYPALTAPTRGPEADEAKRYGDFLVKSITEAVARAHQDRKPARISAAIGREDSLPFNRRFRMKDGTVVFNPGVQNPNIVRPAGPIDPDVPVVYIETPDGKPLATLVNYAMHLDTVGRDAYSADYAGALSKRLSAVKGPEMLTLFSIGTAGNINHIDVTQPRVRPGPQEPARIGTILAAEVLRTYKKLEPLQTDTIRVTRETVQLPPIELEPGEVDKARDLVERERKTGKPLTLLERVYVQRVLFAERQNGRPFETEVSVIAIGNDLAWVGLPGEIFVELGLAIKKGSPFRYTTINELAYDWIRYVPNRKGLQEGSYEATNTRCGAGCGEMLVGAAVNCLLRLHEAPQQRLFQ